MASDEEIAEVQRQRVVEWATATNPMRWWVRYLRLATPFEEHLAMYHLNFLMRGTKTR